MKPLYDITDDLKANVEIAKEQEEYLTLPAHVFEDGQVCVCIQLDEKEIEEVKKEGRVYVSMLTFNKPLQPFFITTRQEVFKEHIDYYQK